MRSGVLLVTALEASAVCASVPSATELQSGKSIQTHACQGICYRCFQDGIETPLLLSPIWTLTLILPLIGTLGPFRMSLYFCTRHMPIPQLWDYTCSQPPSPERAIGRNDSATVSKPTCKRAPDGQVPQQGIFSGLLWSCLHWHVPYCLC